MMSAQPNKGKRTDSSRNESKTGQGVKLKQNGVSYVESSKSDVIILDSSDEDELPKFSTFSPSKKNSRPLSSGPSKLVKHSLSKAIPTSSKPATKSSTSSSAPAQSNVRTTTKTPTFQNGGGGSPARVADASPLNTRTPNTSGRVTPSLVSHVPTILNHSLKPGSVTKGTSKPSSNTVKSRSETVKNGTSTKSQNLSGKTINPVLPAASTSRYVRKQLHTSAATSGSNTPERAQSRAKGSSHTASSSCGKERTTVPSSRSKDNGSVRSRNDSGIGSHKLSEVNLTSVRPFSKNAAHAQCTEKGSVNVIHSSAANSASPHWATPLQNPTGALRSESHPMIVQLSPHVPVKHHGATVHPSPKDTPTPGKHHGATVHPSPKDTPTPGKHHGATVHPSPKDTPTPGKHHGVTFHPSPKDTPTPGKHHGATVHPSPKDMPTPVKHHGATVHPSPKDTPTPGKHHGVTVHPSPKDTPTPVKHHGAIVRPSPKDTPIPGKHHGAIVRPSPKDTPIPGKHHGTTVHPSHKDTPTPGKHHGTTVHPSHKDTPTPVKHHGATVHPSSKDTPTPGKHHGATVHPSSKDTPTPGKHHGATVHPSSKDTPTPGKHHGATVHPSHKDMPTPVKHHGATVHPSSKDTPTPEKHHGATVHPSSKDTPTPVKHHGATVHPSPKDTPTPVKRHRMIVHASPEDTPTPGKRHRMIVHASPEDMPTPVKRRRTIVRSSPKDTSHLKTVPHPLQNTAKSRSNKGLSILPDVLTLLGGASKPPNDFANRKQLGGTHSSKYSASKQSGGKAGTQETVSGPPLCLERPVDTDESSSIASSFGTSVLSDTETQSSTSGVESLEASTTFGVTHQGNARKRFRKQLARKSTGGKQIKRYKLPNKSWLPLKDFGLEVTRIAMPHIPAASTTLTMTDVPPSCEQRGMVSLHPQIKEEPLSPQPPGASSSETAALVDSRIASGHIALPDTDATQSSKPLSSDISKTADLGAMGTATGATNVTADSEALGTANGATNVTVKALGTASGATNVTVKALGTASGATNVTVKALGTASGATNVTVKALGTTSRATNVTVDSEGLGTATGATNVTVKAVGTASGSTNATADSEGLGTVSGTFSTILPTPRKRKFGIRRLSSSDSDTSPPPSPKRHKPSSPSPAQENTSMDTATPTFPEGHHVLMTCARVIPYIPKRKVHSSPNVHFHLQLDSSYSSEVSDMEGGLSSAITMETTSQGNTDDVNGLKSSTNTKTPEPHALPETSNRNGDSDSNNITPKDVHKRTKTKKNKLSLRKIHRASSETPSPSLGMVVDDRTHKSSSLPPCLTPDSMDAGTDSPLRMSPQDKEYSWKLQDTITKLAGGSEIESLSLPRSETPASVNEEGSPLRITVPLTKLKRVMRLPPSRPPPSLSHTPSVTTTRIGVFESKGVQVERGIVIDSEVLDSYLTVKINEALYNLKGKLRATEEEVKKVLEEKERLEEAFHEKVQLIREITRTGFSPQLVEKATLTDSLMSAEAAVQTKRQRGPKHRHVSTQTKTVVSPTPRCLASSSREDLTEYLHSQSPTTLSEAEGETEGPPGSMWLSHVNPDNCSRSVPIRPQVRLIRALGQGSREEPAQTDWNSIDPKLRDLFMELRKLLSTLKHQLVAPILTSKLSKLLEALSHLLSHVPFPNELVESSDQPMTEMTVVDSKLQNLIQTLQTLSEINATLPSYFKAEIVQTTLIASSTLESVLGQDTTAQAPDVPLPKIPDLIASNISDFMNSGNVDPGFAVQATAAPNAKNAAPSTTEAGSRSSSNPTECPSEQVRLTQLSERTAKQFAILQHVTNLLHKKIREIAGAMLRKKIPVPPRVSTLLSQVPVYLASSRNRLSQVPVYLASTRNRPVSQLSSSSQVSTSVTPSIVQVSTKSAYQATPLTKNSQSTSQASSQSNTFSSQSSSTQQNESQITVQSLPPARPSPDLKLVPIHSQSSLVPASSTSVSPSYACSQSLPLSVSNGVSSVIHVNAHDVLKAAEATIIVSANPVMLSGILCTKTTPKQFTNISGLLHPTSPMTTTAAVRALTTPSPSWSLGHPRVSAPRPITSRGTQFQLPHILIPPRHPSPFSLPLVGSNCGLMVPPPSVLLQHSLQVAKQIIHATTTIPSVVDPLTMLTPSSGLAASATTNTSMTPTGGANPKTTGQQQASSFQQRQTQTQHISGMLPSVTAMSIQQQLPSCISLPPFQQRQTQTQQSGRVAGMQPSATPTSIQQQLPSYVSVPPSQQRQTQSQQSGRVAGMQPSATPTSIQQQLPSCISVPPSQQRQTQTQQSGRVAGMQPSATPTSIQQQLPSCISVPPSQQHQTQTQQSGRVAGTQPSATPTSIQQQLPSCISVPPSQQRQTQSQQSGRVAGTQPSATPTSIQQQLPSCISVPPSQQHQTQTQQSGRVAGMQPSATPTSIQQQLPSCISVPPSQQRQTQTQQSGRVAGTQPSATPTSIQQQLPSCISVPPSQQHQTQTQQSGRVAGMQPSATPTSIQQQLPSYVSVPPSQQRQTQTQQSGRVAGTQPSATPISNQQLSLMNQVISLKVTSSLLKDQTPILQPEGTTTNPHSEPLACGTLDSTQPLASTISLPMPKIQTRATDNGIVIKWTFDGEHLHKQHYVIKYELYACVGTRGTRIPPISEWGKVGEIDPLPLPMQVTLTNFAKGQAYSFAVRARFRGGGVSAYSDSHTSFPI